VSNGFIQTAILDPAALSPPPPRFLLSSDVAPKVQARRVRYDRLAERWNRHSRGEEKATYGADEDARFYVVHVEDESSRN